MRLSPCTVVIIASLVPLSTLATAAERPPRTEAAPRVQDRVLAVPERASAPILLDGLFTAGEWDDAVRIDGGGGVTLLFKRDAGHLFIGVRCPGLEAPVADLFIQPAGNEIHQLHASAQIGERVVVEGEDRPYVWGRSPDWQANEIRWDQARMTQLMSQGVEQAVAQRQAMFPYEGFEFQIRQKKFGGTEWRFRVEVRSHPNYQAPIAFPAGTRATHAAGWLRLLLHEAR